LSTTTTCGSGICNGTRTGTRLTINGVGYIISLYTEEMECRYV